MRNPNYASLIFALTWVLQFASGAHGLEDTDAVPIHNARYRSNWELSSARSVTMLELLTTRYNVSENRLSVGGYAETVPIASNDNAEGRAQNRRVDIVILNENGLRGEPGRQ